MNGVNQNISIPVHSSRGIIPIHKLVPGDSVYEYGSDQLLEVQEVVKMKPSAIWEAGYTDGRTSIHGVTEMMYCGDKLMNVIDVLMTNGSLLNPFKQYPVKFIGRHDLVVKPDPYMAGAFLMYGDRNDQYLNLPTNRMDLVMPVLQYAYINYKLEATYSWESLPAVPIVGGYSGKILNPQTIASGKVYFSFNRNLVTWNEIFKNIDLNTIIPNIYRTSKVEDRWQFVRGVFDYGFVPKAFPQGAGIVNESEGRLKAFQSLLWSLGIVSLISYDPTISECEQYRLDVVGEYDGYPGLFYDADYIRRMTDTTHQAHYPKFELAIEQLNQIPSGYLYNIRVDKSQALYLTKNLLPRVSL